jgi:flagellar biosynthesis GTPase FlhF
MHAATLTRSGWLAVLLLAAAPLRAESIQLPNGSELRQVDFERHVAGLLGRMGCNTGACHGSFQGKGGLYLSLFGYSPEKDYLSFTREGMGRRTNVLHPDQSLLLLKATGQVSHGGGKRFEKHSWQYQVIREWIAQGARWQPGKGTVKSVEVTPGEHRFAKSEQTQPLKVMVDFADGTREDMTAFTDFRVNDDYVADVSAGGVVRGIRPGDTTVVATYRGNVVTSRAMIPAQVGAEFVYPRLPEHNFIDTLVLAKLRKLNIVPSDTSSDSEFLRRVYIDTIGSLPSPEDVRAFLADRNSNKREQKIDELLRHPLHAALWATKFSDITGNNVDVMEQPQQLRPKRSKMWHDWLRKRFAENMPYDQIVHGVLCATSRDGRPPEDWAKQAVAIDKAAENGFESEYANRTSLDLFWRRGNNINGFPLELMAEHTAAAFMGVRLECAQCHKHPFDRWTQTDYRAYANVFSQVKFGASPESQSVISQANAQFRQGLNEALAAVEKENAQRRKTAEETIEKENEQRREKVEATVKDESEEKQKAALAKVDKENADRKTVALANVDRENQLRRQQTQNRFAQRQQTQLREIYVDSRQLRRLADPTTNGALAARALGGPEIPLQGDAREVLFNWLVQPDNPFFARSFVNRVWAHYFGIGLVEPADNFSVANPPSNPALLDALAREFTEHQFDIRHIEKIVLMSRTYQVSAIPNSTNVHDRNNFARSYLRRMLAEVMVDVLNSALGVSENFGPDVPAGIKAVEVAPNRVQNPNLMYIFRIFGRPPRTASCDCERAAEPALPQTLFLMTDQNLLGKLQRGRLEKLIRDRKSDAEIVDEMFMATLCRPPNQNEREAALDHIKSKSDRNAGLVNVVWALINTREFVLNH